MAVDSDKGISKAEVIDCLRYVADVCSGRVAVEVTEVVKSTREMDAETVTVSKLLFEPTGALRAYELIGRYLGMWRESAPEQKVEMVLSEQGGKRREPLDVPAVGENWSEQGYSAAPTSQTGQGGE